MSQSSASVLLSPCSELGSDTLKYEIKSFNYEEDTKINTFSEAKEAAEQVASGSDLDCFDAPKSHVNSWGFLIC